MTNEEQKKMFQEQERQRQEQQRREQQREQQRLQEEIRRRHEQGIQKSQDDRPIHGRPVDERPERDD